LVTNSFAYQDCRLTCSPAEPNMHQNSWRSPGPHWGSLYSAPAGVG